MREILKFAYFIANCRAQRTVVTPAYAVSFISVHTDNNDIRMMSFTRLRAKSAETERRTKDGGKENGKEKLKL